MEGVDLLLAPARNFGRNGMMLEEGEELAAYLADDASHEDREMRCCISHDDVLGRMFSYVETR